MTPFDWNGLRPGDAVFVHTEGGGAAVSSVIGIVERGTARRPAGIAVRVGDTSELIWTSASRTHVAPVAADCWRCVTTNATDPAGD